MQRKILRLSLQRNTEVGVAMDQKLWFQLLTMAEFFSHFLISIVLCSYLDIFYGIQTLKSTHFFLCDTTHSTTSQALVWNELYDT